VVSVILEEIVRRVWKPPSFVMISWALGDARRHWGTLVIDGVFRYLRSNGERD